MNNLTALSISIAVLAGLATFLAVGPLSGIFLYGLQPLPGPLTFSGRHSRSIKNTIVCGIFGVFMAWLAAIQITNIPSSAILGFPFWAAVTVTCSVVVMCLAANIPALATIPASVLGYSSTFAYLLQTPGKLTKDILLSASLDNPLIVISISIVVGTYFGLWSGQLSAKLTK
jgi:Protein of unknown function (DUF1097).